MHVTFRRLVKVGDGQGKQPKKISLGALRKKNEGQRAKGSMRLFRYVDGQRVPLDTSSRTESRVTRPMYRIVDGKKERIIYPGAVQPAEVENVQAVRDNHDE